MAASSPSQAMASVRAMIISSGSCRAWQATLIFVHISPASTSVLSSRCPQRLGKAWSSICRAATPALSNARTVRSTFAVPPKPVSASAITGRSQASTIRSSCASTSVNPSSPMSGMPAERAMAPPLAYTASNPASSARRADRPSKTPGAITLRPCPSRLRSWRVFFMCSPLQMDIWRGIPMMLSPPATVQYRVRTASERLRFQWNCATCATSS